MSESAAVRIVIYNNVFEISGVDVVDFLNYISIHKKFFTAGEDIFGMASTTNKDIHYHYVKRCYLKGIMKGLFKKRKTFSTTFRDHDLPIQETSDYNSPTKKKVRFSNEEPNTQLKNYVTRGMPVKDLIKDTFMD